MSQDKVIGSLFCREESNTSKTNKEDKNETQADIIALTAATACLNLMDQANFDSLPDDMLYKILEFEGKASYIVIGLINKRCRAIFKMYDLPRQSFKYAYAPLSVIQNNLLYGMDKGIGKAVVWYDRHDLLDWCIDTQDSVYHRAYRPNNYWDLSDPNDRSRKGELWWICYEVLCFPTFGKSSKFSILKKVVTSANDNTMKHIRGSPTLRSSDPKEGQLLTEFPAKTGNLALLNYLRVNGCHWNIFTWKNAKQNGHTHILKWLYKKYEGNECMLKVFKENNFPTLD